MLERWTAAVLRFRVAVVAFWLVVLVAGAWAAVRLPALLSNSFVVPGTDSDRALAVLTKRFGERTDGGFVVVFRVRHPSDRALRARLRARLREAARSVPTAHVGRLLPGGGVLYGDVDTTLDLHVAKRYTDELRRALARQGGPPALVTGQPAIQHDLDPILAQDLRRGEALAFPIALAVLLGVLGLSLAVAVPFVFAACTISATLGVVYLVAHQLAVVTWVTNLVELIGLGLAIDYSMLIVHRQREELARGGSADDAVVRTMATAGRSVVFSGLTVAIGLALLLFVPVPFVRSMGVGGLLIPLLSVAAAITLQPALLSFLGERGMRRVPVAGLLRSRLRLRLPSLPGNSDVDRGFWARLSRSIMRHPVPYLVAGTAIMLAAAAPAAAFRLTPGSLSGLPSSPESLRALDLLRTRAGRGVVTPIQVVVDGGAAAGARRPAVHAAVERLADELFRDPEVFVVASGTRSPFVEPEGRYARVIVAGRHEYGEPPSRALVRRIRGVYVPRARFPDGVRVEAGGPPAQGVDFLDRAYAAFPWLVAAVVVLTYALLLRAFRSLLLPLKAVVLNALSVAAVYGLLVVVFREGAGRLVGLERAPEIEGWIPIFLFATLFGLSMDYEVFLVSRMRESWDHVPDNARAVAHGLQRTGRIVTAAALIMVAAFSGFVVGRVAGLQQFGVGLALGVALDATVVRMMLVPSLMAVVGRMNWWLPARVARLAGVEPSPVSQTR